MRIKKILASFLILTILGGFFINRIIKDTKNIEVDTVALNEVSNLVSDNWERLNEYIFKGVSSDFIVINLKGELKYSSKETDNKGYEERLNEAIKNKNIIFDSKVNGEIVGKIIIESNEKSFADSINEGKIKAVLVVYFGFVALCTIYLLYIEKSIYKPFNKLKGFAENIAKGNLDTPLEMDKNNIFGVFTESFDIMREEIKSSKRREYQVVKSKNEFVAALSHDIKTPVASIKAVSEVMEIKAKSEEELKNIKIINNKAEQINKLVSNIFDFALEELDELKVNISEGYSDEIIRIIERADYFNKVTFHGEMPKVMINMDSFRLQQVIDNIIINSYKYANTEIQVSFQIDNKQLQIYIKDFGPGAKEEELPLLYNKFFRGYGTKNIKGTGLGLYISKYLMDKMQGDIDCYNEDVGFVVKLGINIC